MENHLNTNETTAPVEPEVLPPERTDALSPPGRLDLLHPMSGIIVLLLDYVLFGANAASFGLAVAVSMFIGFVASFAAVTLIQRFLEEEPWGKSIAKAIFCGIVVGMPTPVFGTALGALVLAISGLSRVPFIGKLLAKLGVGGKG